MDKNTLRKHMDEQRSTLYKNNNFNELCLKVQNHVLKHPLFLSAKKHLHLCPGKKRNRCEFNKPNSMGTK